MEQDGEQRALSMEQLARRMRALYDDLGHATPDAPCAWPLARVFNTLLAEVRGILVEDPIVMSMSSLRPSDKAGLVSHTPNAAVRALAGQLLAAMPSDLAS
jgi:hypothetical protein